MFLCVVPSRREAKCNARERGGRGAATHTPHNGKQPTRGRGEEVGVVHGETSKQAKKKKTMREREKTLNKNVPGESSARGHGNLCLISLLLASSFVYMCTSHIYCPILVDQDNKAVFIMLASLSCHLQARPPSEFSSRSPTPPHTHAQDAARFLLFLPSCLLPTYNNTYISLTILNFPHTTITTITTGRRRSSSSSFACCPSGLLPPVLHQHTTTSPSSSHTHNNKRGAA